jgi:hypothetical protein
MSEREARAWSAAKEGDPDEAMRLADLVGCTGLRERAAQVGLRSTAIRSMEYCADFSELPWLVQVGVEAEEGEARDALNAVVMLAARRRAANDPEDAEELHAACAALLTLAKDGDRPRGRRVLAVRALRMLADRGCVRPAEIPRDFDSP